MSWDTEQKLITFFRLFLTVTTLLWPVHAFMIFIPLNPHICRFFKLNSLILFKVKISANPALIQQITLTGSLLGSRSSDAGSSTKSLSTFLSARIRLFILNIKLGELGFLIKKSQLHLHTLSTVGVHGTYTLPVNAFIWSTHAFFLFFLKNQALRYCWPVAVVADQSTTHSMRFRPAYKAPSLTRPRTLKRQRLGRVIIARETARSRF